jgi:TRAP transporter 4TM/12TM fusion protein
MTTAIEPQMTGLAKIAFTAISVGLVLFSLYTAMFGVFPDIIQRGVHLSAALALVYVRVFDLASAHEGASGSALRRGLLLTAGVIAASVASYQVVFYDAVTARFGAITDFEIPIAIALIVLLLDATRRTMGWSMVVLAVVFLAYALGGQYFPDIISHRGYDVPRVLEQVYLGADGIFGTPLGVSATFVIVIVILGALLERSGASGVLMDIAIAMTRKSRGGLAKAAVVGSSLMGMISGTAVANVLTTGTISIPLMKRGGYKGSVAGAIEAVASTGGQLMPPIMGAAAFLMADVMEVPYLDITKAALIPALLFYVAVFASVHLEAAKAGLAPLNMTDMPSVKSSLLRSGHVLIAIPVFITALLVGYSVMYSSLAGILCVLALSVLKKSSRMGPAALIDACVSAAEAILPVALATATAGIIIAVVTLTGLGLKFSSLIITLSGNNLLAALVLTMASSLILGMGLPTAAAYILVATLTAPALVTMGVDLMAAHMFVFYSAMLSSITPPVALAAFAAAAISREPPMRIAVIAVKYGFVAFLIPYFFVFDVRFLSDGGLFGILLVFAAAIVGVIMLACAIQGYMLMPLGWLVRTVLACGAIAILTPDFKFKLAGTAIIVAVVIVQKLGQNKENRPDATSPSGSK